MNNYKESWAGFILEFEEAISPIYQRHEEEFDYFGFHGVRHVSRVLIFAELMSRYYYKYSKEDIDFYAIRVAVAFHDSARENSGKDYWEKQSAEKCFAYLVEKDCDETYAKKVSNRIIRNKNGVVDLMDQIVYDADVLDIMRLFVDSGFGWKKFRQNEFIFLTDNHIDSGKNKLNKDREKFVLEAWKFISETEKAITNNRGLINSYLNHIINNNESYPFMASLLN